MKKNILDNDRNYIWHPFTNIKQSKPPIVISSANNDKLIDIDGNEYLDLISSWWVNIHGHSKKEIIESITEQSKLLDQVVFADLTHEPAVKLAKKLSELLPGDLNRIFYSDNGSTSVEIAMKVCYQFWFNQGIKKNQFVALNGGYHGDTLGAMSVGFSSGFYQPFNDLVIDTHFLPYPENYIGNNSIEEKELYSLDQADKIIDKYGKDLIAIIIEPLIQGASGMKICRPKYLNTLVKKFKQNNILVIFDEVMTGFGRTGKMFATDYLNIIPDVVCLAKSITGGYLPLAATIFTETIHRQFMDLDISKSFLHGHSFTANPIACSAANTSIELFGKENTFLKIEQIQKLHQEGLELINKNSSVSKVRMIGTIAAFDLDVLDAAYGSNVSTQIKERFLEKGYIIRPLGKTIYLMPPYCISVATLQKAYEDIDFIIHKFSKEIL
ncbi:MAG: adenosylmethionine--8-amino-7-oxononanoate transaminase [Rickettsiales bacterium]|nr:adenosylmethionine--8-amino-7-oxononanoate transaminase [Rickettsiales bacterium]